MKKEFIADKGYIFLIMGFLFFCLCPACYSEETVSSADLINKAKQYDGKIVSYKGEVIGDIMARKEFAWINVNDGVNAIGIWSKKDLFKDIVYTGSYISKGDMVEVKGIFHRACLEHGGDLDIHAETLSKIESGMVIRKKLNTAKIKTAFVLFGAMCITAALSQLKFKHKQGAK